MALSYISLGSASAAPASSSRGVPKATPAKKDKEEKKEAKKPAADDDVSKRRRQGESRPWSGVPRDWFGLLSGWGVLFVLGASQGRSRAACIFFVDVDAHRRFLRCRRARGTHSSSSYCNQASVDASLYRALFSHFDAGKKGVRSSRPELDMNRVLDAPRFCLVLCFACLALANKRTWLHQQCLHTPHSLADCWVSI